MNESEFLKRRNKANGIIGAVKETSSNSRRTTPPKSSSPTTTKMSESQFIKRRNMARYRKLGVSEKMSAIIDTALGKEWANTPYVWGGTSKNGADCSGFVQSVFKQNGVNISRTTSTQINDGTPVDLKDLKIGDLVFYGKGSPSHVGIYIGNGLVRHSGGGDERNTAANPGKGVQTSPINYRSDFYGARRIDTGDAVPVEELGATKNNAQKKTTTFLDDTNNAYSKAKDKVKNKNVVVNSDMSENERKARIKEIDDELKRIGAIRMGFRRGGGVSDSVVSEYEDKAKKLQQEKKSLERVGTFTSSQLKQFEIDDAKAEKAKLPAYNPTARVMPHQVEEYKANIAAHSEADKKIDTLKRQKTLYKDITKYGDDVHEDNFGGQWSANYRSSELSREADKAMSEYIRNPTEENKEIAYAYDAFAKEYAKNNAKALDDENVKASWLTKSMAGYLPQLRDQIAPELIGGGIGLMFGGTAGASIGAGLATYAQSYEVIQGSVYRTLLAEGVDEKTALSAAQDEALISSLIEGGETTLGWLISGGGKALSAIGAAAKTSVAKGSTNAAVKFMAGLGGKTVDRAAKKAVNAVTRPLWKTGLRVAGGIVGNGLTEYGEEFAQGAVSIANHEKAYKTVEEEIGQYGMGNVNLYQRPVYTNADGSISTVDSVTFEIDGKFVLLPTIARDENGKVIRLETDEEILAHFGETGEFLGEFDTLEEANAYATKLHTAQAYLHSQNNGVTADDSLWSGGAKVVKNALSGNNKEALSELHGQGMEGFKIGLMMGGSQTIANNIVAHYANAKTVKNQNEIADTIIADEESLNALIEEGKASGAGTVSEDIATEIETAKANGKAITREQVKSLIEANEVYIKEEERIEKKTAQPKLYASPVTNVVEEKSKNNETVTVDEVQKATSFGKSGSELVTDYTNVEGKTFNDVVAEVKPAYFAGMNQPDMDVNSMESAFISDMQRQAFRAGQIDRQMEDMRFKTRSEQAVIYDGTFTENELTKNFTKQDRILISTIAKSFGMDVSVVDKIIANKSTGAEANAQHIGGKMEISNNRDANKAVFRLVLHEGGHRMNELAPEEFGALMNALYKFSTRANEKAGLPQTFGIDNVKADYDRADLSMNTLDYFEEFAVREIENIFGSARAFNRWYAEISGNQQAKSGWQKIVDYIFEIIDDIKRALKLAKLSKADRAEAIAQLDRIKELYANAYKAAENAVVEKRKTQANKVANNSTASKENNKSFSIQKNYDNEINIWNKRGKPDGETFVLGVTGDVLQGLGAIESDIYMLGDKIKEILATHSEMSIEEIKKIPQILEDPVLILKSKNAGRGKKQNTRLIVFGNIKAQDGRPILSVLDLRPIENNLVVDDMQKVSSAYTKDVNPVDFVKSSFVVYVDKKRTTKLLRTIGFKTPIELQQSGYIGSISYKGQNVNIFGENFEKIFKEKDVASYSLKGTLSDTEIREAITNKKLDKYAKKGIITTEKYNELVKTYGAIPEGEKPHRTVEVPQKTAEDKKVSQTVRTILEAKATPDEYVPTIEKMVEDGVFSYDVYTDEKAINDADSYIKKYGWDESLDDWFKDVEKGVVSKQHTAMGWALYNNAANIAATTTSETERTSAVKTSLKILDAMVRHQRSAAQALQATRILKQLSPETQLYAVQKSVQAFQKELEDKYGDKAPDLKINEELAEQFIKAETDEERAEIEAEIYKDIGRQMPSRFIDKWNAWRYLAMLGNPRTHVRNIVGNTGFAPVVFVKDLAATAIESIVYRVSGKKTVRGKALVIGSKTDRALLKAAWGDYGNVADKISNGGKYNDSAMANQHIEEGRRIFKFKPLEAARKGNSALLEKEDMWFAQPHYAYALAQYCKANNITAEQIKRGKAIAPARDYAIKEAQKATYRDTNVFSQLVSELGRKNRGEKNGAKKFVSTVIEGILPFRKTPANILVRGVEYSPIGLLKGLTYDLSKVIKGKMTASEAIDNISAGLTGTGLLTLGVFLAAQGIIRGHGGEDKDENGFEELMGHQTYALELPDGTSITLDWLAPEALPFFVGVNIWEATKGSEEEVNMSSILKAVSGITEPMLEMSCLQGLNDLFEGIGYASSNDTSGLVSVISSAVTSYITQGIPTLFDQTERTGEAERMSTYTEKNAFLTGDMQYTLGKASAKIPFWDYNQIPYIDAWGRREASGVALKRGLNNFLNPAYISTVKSSRMEKELLRLYESTGEASVFPSRADKYFTVDGERKDLTAEEYVRYATLKGEKSYKVVYDLVSSDAYKKLSDTEKAKAVSDAYDYANQKAKEAISSYAPDKWVSKADEFGDNVGSYISFRTEVSAVKKENEDKISKQQVADIILDMAQNDSDMWNMYLSMYESKGDLHAYEKGVSGEDYMLFLEALNEVDEPTKSGKYGSYTQDEARKAVNQLDGLSQTEKKTLWQSVNTTWKRNPF